MLTRISRAIRFDPSLYREVAADPSAIVQAAVIMFFSALAWGFGFHEGLKSIEGYEGRLEKIFLWSFANHVLVWVLLGVLLFIVRRLREKQGVSLLPGFTGIGFAHVPGVFYVFMMFGSEFFILLVNVLVILMLVASFIIAIRQTTRVPVSIAFPMGVIGVILVIRIRDNLAWIAG
ncbi:MAG: hypothetical protein HY532_09030 [Chloroflexi bacterium]|nr:hypothetical protein [Chloroflexota bacterium]